MGVWVFRVRTDRFHPAFRCPRTARDGSGGAGCATSDPPYRSAGATDPMHESPSFFLPPNKNAPLSQERSQERSVHLICPEPVLTLTNILGLNAKMAFKAGSFCLAHLRMDHGINRHAIKLKAAHATVTVPFPD